MGGLAAEGGEKRTRAWIEAGDLRVGHPEEGPYPVVVPCPGVDLYVNRQRRDGPVEVRRGSRVLVHVVSELTARMGWAELPCARAATLL